MSTTSAPVGERFLALMLMIGGIAGVGIILYLGPSLLRIRWLYAIPAVLLLWLFAWSALVGYRFWRQEARGWKWATLLFAFQTPIITVPDFTYEYYTGIAIKLLGGHVHSPFGFAVGANANIYLDPHIHDVVWGSVLDSLNRRPGAIAYLTQAIGRNVPDQPALHDS